MTNVFPSNFGTFGGASSGGGLPTNTAALQAQIQAKDGAVLKMQAALKGRDQRIAVLTQKLRSAGIAA